MIYLCGMEDYNDDNDKAADDADNNGETDDNKVNDEKLFDESGQHIPPYISEEDDELTEGDDEFEESEIMEDTSDGMLNIYYIINCSHY